MSKAIGLRASILTVGIASFLLCPQAICGQAPQSPSPPAAPETRRPPQNDNTGSCLQCGQERWDVKTLSDAAASTVDFAPKSSTVKDLYNITAPTSGSSRHSSEMQTYTVHAKLIGYKIEFNAADPNPGDRDFHIVIQDMNGPETMIVEIPDPECLGVCTSLKKDAITQARSDFQNGVTAQPESRFLTLKDPVEVDVAGVLFFDFAHGQSGLAKNCAELHPVLAFNFSTKPTAESDPSKEPKPHPQSFYNCLPEGGGPPAPQNPTQPPDSHL